MRHSVVVLVLGMTAARARGSAIARRLPLFAAPARRRWHLACTLAPAYTRGTLDVLVIEDRPGAALLQIWERDDHGEHRVEAAIRLDNAHLHQLAEVIEGIARGSSS